MVMLMHWVVLLDTLSTTGAEPPDGLMDSPPIAQWSSIPWVQDMLTVAAPGSVLAAPPMGAHLELSNRFQRSVWPAPTVREMQGLTGDGVEDQLVGRGGHIDTRRTCAILCGALQRGRGECS